MTQAENTVAEVVHFMERLYRRGLTTTSGGNISCRASAETICMTPSAIDKGRLQESQIAELTLAGANLTPRSKPSIEAEMHLAIYRRHAHVGAIVHAHPPVASTFTVVDRELNCRLIAEAYALLGRPAVAAYALMGTAALAETVATAIDTDVPCVLMRNHGALTVGRDLLEAFDRMEVLEQVARINVLAHALGGGREMEAADIANIDRFMGRTA